MKAAVFYEPNKPMRVEEVEDPDITSQEVLVRIKACGICRGDLQRVSGAVSVDTPMILGHEPAGKVAKVGSEVEGFKPGDDVLLFAAGCGECYYCKIGKDNICQNLINEFGIGRDGAYAEYCKVHPRCLQKLPEGISYEAGSVMTASTGTVFHGITLADIHAGDTVVVYGAGCLGTQALQLMKIMGATVFVVDVRDRKLDMAKRLGADAVINAGETDPVKEIRALTGGRGADVAFEIIGLPVTILQAIDSVRPAGKIIDIGAVMEPINLKMIPFIDEGLALNKELTLMTISHCSRKDMAKLMDVVKQGRIDFDTGTLTLPLDEINRAFEIKKSSDNLRVVIQP